MPPAETAGRPKTIVDHAIAKVVAGRSFADVGGLWGAINEKVSVALLAGARAASMIDIAPLGHQLWGDFDARCAEIGVSGYRCVRADATSPDLRTVAGTFEVVHCAGVIYHVPDLVGFVRNLSSIATRHLILNSMVVDEQIENEFGSLDLSGGHCLFVPAMNETQRKIAGRYLDERGLQVAHLNGPPVNTWLDNGKWRFGPWCWLITPQFLRGLAEICGLTVVEEGFVWKGRSYAIVCEVPQG